MLSYQHAYHAGGPADVVKHAVWAAILHHMSRKEGAIHAFETHAGRGLYAVDSGEMQKTPEYKTGVGKLYPAKFPAEVELYREIVAELNPEGRLDTVPGSPAVAAAVLREEDHLHLVEAHPVELEHLKEAFPHAVRRAKQIHIHEGNGHMLVPNLMRAGQRTAVLIDPSYEVKAEYLQVVETVKELLVRNPKATIMIWYPLIAQHRNHRQKLIDGLKDLNVPATWLGHVSWNRADDVGMYGTGQIVLNLPYKIEDGLGQMLKTLTPLLKQKVADGTATLMVPRR